MTKATAGFMFDVSQNLLSLASIIQLEEHIAVSYKIVSLFEFKRFLAVEYVRKKMCLVLFNGVDGTPLFLSVRKYSQKVQVLYCT